MESMQNNITALCPGAFSGASGNLFAGAVTAVIAAHCAILNNQAWPKDNAEEILRKASDGISYDFIVVGAGTAGSLVASHLSILNPSWSVLLIEAGDDPGIDSEVPGFMLRNKYSNFDWQYYTNQNNHSCLGFKDSQCVWSKGKAMGGSSSINAMIYVRGHRNDFNNWEKMGNHGWGYEELVPYFEELERNLNLTEYTNSNPWYTILHSAWQELSIKNIQNNEETVTGTKIAKVLIRKGKRLNTAKEYLSKSTNLHVMKNTMVEKVLIDPETKITRGVTVRHANGILMQISVTKEVILSAGSVATPQILMLSGIGPKNHLNEIEIECIIDLPVGKNLQDHIMLPLHLKTDLQIELPPEQMTHFLMEYMLTKTGPLSDIGILNFLTFTNINDITDNPDIQFFHAFFNKKDFILRPTYEAFGYKDEIIQIIQEVNKNNSILSIFPILLHPQSKGEILLADKNPYTKPIIETNYFKHADDIQILLKGINYVRELEKTSTFKQHGIKIVHLKIPGCDHPLATDKYWECYIRHIATTIYHPVGTAAMGVAGNSVVDKNLLVYGIKKLRVVDASVMPTITGGNTVAPTLVIARKAVDIIEKQYKYKDEL